MMGPEKQSLRGRLNAFPSDRTSVAGTGHILDHSQRSVWMMHDGHELTHSERWPRERRAVSAVQHINLAINNESFPWKSGNMIGAAETVDPPAFPTFRVILRKADDRDLGCGQYDFVDLRGSRLHPLQGLIEWFSGLRQNLHIA
jgi:hypothetical protein